MTVRIERPADHVAEIVMDRPDALNAVSADQARAIGDACQQVTDAPHIRAVILSSTSEKAFCVGADLKERNALTNEELQRQRPITQAAYGGVLHLPMPTIAAVDGHALGGGCELALACDLIVASENAVFGLPEVGVGVIPGGGGTQLLSRRLGLNRAADLIFTTRRVEVEEAIRIGLADRHSRAGRARSDAMQLATRIAGKSPVGLRNAKRALRDGFDRPLPEGLEIEADCWQQTAFSRDRLEGVAAFNEKREPNWPG